MSQWKKLWTKDIKITACQVLRKLVQNVFFPIGKDIANLDSNYKGTCQKCKEVNQNFYHIWWSFKKTINWLPVSRARGRTRGASGRVLTAGKRGSNVYLGPLNTLHVGGIWKAVNTKRVRQEGVKGQRFPKGSVAPVAPSRLADWWGFFPTAKGLVRD